MARRKKLHCKYGVSKRKRHGRRVCLKRPRHHRRRRHSRRR